MRRTYEARTYGCQMNVPDSERIAGPLDEAGYAPVADGAQPDVVVFETCAVRENADNKLYGNLGHLKPVKDRTPGRQIAVSGCLAQKDQATIVERVPYIDGVFGTHNVGSLPVLLERARVEQASQVELQLVRPASRFGRSVGRSSIASASEKCWHVHCSEITSRNRARQQRLPTEGARSCRAEGGYARPDLPP